MEYVKVQLRVRNGLTLGNNVKASAEKGFGLENKRLPSGSEKME
jgi:hypothetical protein